MFDVQNSTKKQIAGWNANDIKNVHPIFWAFTSEKEKEKRLITEHLLMLSMISYSNLMWMFKLLDNHQWRLTLLILTTLNSWVSEEISEII